MIELPIPTVQQLFDAGVHFGHTKARWNPKMAPYIHNSHGKTYIIDLNQTVSFLETAIKKIHEVSKKNGKILFVGTKNQASASIRETAEKCGQHYVNKRWLGGMLTNWNTIKSSIKTLDSIEKTLSDLENDMYTKKEILEFNRKKDKLVADIGGIRTMSTLPNLLVVIDTNIEAIAIKEARNLGIDVIAIVDTNSDPDGIEIPIPGNDDGPRSIKLFCDIFAQAALSGMEASIAASRDKDEDPKDSQKSSEKSVTSKPSKT